ncbi:hypothetical protein NQZ68_031236 [Dissostichus eleginoides]|nr:hypothetical protein NQZ68_031236 [Dissostichus eleginoides]
MGPGLRPAHPAEIPPKTKDVQCTSLRVGEMHGRRKDGGCRVQETGDDGAMMPVIIRMRIQMPGEGEYCR